MNETLRHNAEQFHRFVADVADYAIFLLDTEGHVSSWNLGAESIKGYKAEEIIGQHFSRFYPDEVVAQGWPAYELQTARLEGRFEDEGWRVRKDGTRFWANVVITALRDEHGEIYGFSKITRDLTERKRHEEQLRESEERFRSLVEGVRDYAIFLLNPDGRVASWNSGAEHLNGYRAEEIIGRHFSVFYPPEQCELGDPEREIEQAKAQGRYEDEGWRVRKDGTRFWANVVLTALWDERGELRGFSKITRDLTEQKMAEERLRKMNAELGQRVNERTAELARINASLRQANRRKDEFLATLAHELRNPLAPLRTGLEVLKLAGADPSLTEETRAIMEQQLEQMVRLIDDLLDVSRVTRGILRLRKEPLQLASAIKGAIEATRPLISDANHTLTTDLPPEPIYLNADPVRLTQIFSNLLSNAAKYSEPGGRISVKARVHGSEVVVSVKDTGIGIPEEHLPNVFEMFSQVDSALERSNGGLGIGLALVRGLVESHGGRVEARSEGPGHGSEFLVRLPTAAAPENASEKRTSPVPGMNPTTRRRILVADDNRDAAHTLETMLKLLGHDVRTAHDGLEAVREAEAFQPHLVLLDVGMPNMNGYEAARHLRQQPWARAMTLVAVTGWSQEEDKRRAKEAGFDHHLTKPAEVAAVQEIIARIEGDSSRVTEPKP